MTILVRSLWLASLALALSSLGYAPAYAATCGGTGQLPCDQCDISGALQLPACNPTNDLNLAITTSGGYDAVRSDPGNATAPIDAWATNSNPPPQPIEYCRYVNNSGTQSIFVPFKSAPEWAAFLNHLPQLVSVQHCSRKHTFTISAGPACTNPSPATQNVTFPYQPYDQVNHQGASYTITPNPEFTCNPGPNQWTETVVVKSTGLDADSNDPSWNPPTSTYYDGNGGNLCNRPPAGRYEVCWGGCGQWYDPPALCVNGATASALNCDNDGTNTDQCDWTCTRGANVSQCHHWTETTCGNNRC